MSLFVIAGATGHTAAPVAEALLRAGKKVRVIGRDAKSLGRFAGAEQAVGSLEDFEFTQKAFAGASAAYVLVPPNFTLQGGGFRAYQNRVIQSQLEALRRAGTSHVMTLSSIGAHRGTGVGPVGGLFDMERAFAAYLPKANVLHLRPGYFMENLLMNVPMIKSMGIMGSAIAGDTSMICIATKDIGAVAARRMLELDWKGHSAQELLGARDVTMNEVARVIGAAIGKPDLAYVAFPYADAHKGMVQAGVNDELAGLYVEMSRAFNEGLRPTQARTAANTTPTTIEDFAKSVFAPAFKAS